MLPLPASPPTLNVVIAPLLVLKSRPLLTLTVTVLFCTALALFKAIVPAEIVVPPRSVLLPASVRMPVPVCVRLPLPLMLPANVGLSERSKISCRVVRDFAGKGCLPCRRCRFARCRH